MTEKIKRDNYQDVIERTLLYVFENGKLPSYASINGKKILKKDIQDACQRSNNYFKKNGKCADNVNMVLQSDTPATQTKTAKHLAQESALGKTWTTMTQFYTAVQTNGVYLHYNNPQYSYAQELARIKAKLGLNCADWLQFTKEVMEELNKEGKKYQIRKAHVKCKNSKGIVNPEAGHYFAQLTGEEFGSTWKDFDTAEAASAGKPIGSTMCTYGYGTPTFNDLADDS